VPVDAWQVMKSGSKIMAAVPVRITGFRTVFCARIRCGTIDMWLSVRVGRVVFAMATPWLMYVAVCMCVL